MYQLYWLIRLGFAWAPRKGTCIPGVQNQQQIFGLPTNIMIDDERPTDKIGHFRIGECAPLNNLVL